MRVSKPGELDDAIMAMIEHKGPVVMDCRVANLTNCFPMIPSGKPHNEILLTPDDDLEAEQISEAMGEGAALV